MQVLMKLVTVTKLEGDTNLDRATMMRFMFMPGQHEPIPGEEGTAHADPRGGTCLAGGGRGRSPGNAWPQLAPVGMSPSLVGGSEWAEYQ